MLTRLEWLLGSEKVDSLQKKSVAVFGCGGVGSFAVEAFVRSGIKRIVLIDGDQVSISNLNRQLIATTDTIGKRKVDVTKERVLSINPEVQVETFDIVYTAEAYPDLLEQLQVGFVVDAVDMVTAKLDLIENCQRLEIPIISSMGAGNRVHPELLTLADIYKTHSCPLAKVMRKELRKRHIKKQMVVFSTELPLEPQRGDSIEKSPGSCAFVPSVAGFIIASYVIRTLVEVK